MEPSKIKKDSQYTYIFSFTQEDVNLFAKATGDSNPIHLDEAYAKNTIFNDPIIHGFLGGSVFSRVFGTLWPGEGTIYLKQNLKFVKPMRRELEYSAVFKVIEVYPDKHRALVKTDIFHNDALVLEGDALIMNHHKI